MSVYEPRDRGESLIETADKVEQTLASFRSLLTVGVQEQFSVRRTPVLRVASPVDADRQSASPFCRRHDLDSAAIDRQTDQGVPHRLKALGELVDADLAVSVAVQLTEHVAQFLAAQFVADGSQFLALDEPRPVEVARGEQTADVSATARRTIVRTRVLARGRHFRTGLDRLTPVRPPTVLCPRSRAIVSTRCVLYSTRIKYSYIKILFNILKISPLACRR